MRAVFLTVSLSGAVFSSVSCSWRSPAQPAVLVILVENLGFGTFSCQEQTSQDDEGFDAFCQESVRFTHAYAPSTLTQPNVVSILTGMYPTEHGVRHNGAQALSAKTVTVDEAARTKGYKTSFFSGGPPIWRRSGISQGFDTFDDNISVSLKSPYRPSSAIVDAFLNWQANRAPNGKFVGVLSFADAQASEIKGDRRVFGHESVSVRMPVGGTPRPKG